MEREQLAQGGAIAPPRGREQCGLRGGMGVSLAMGES
jgi:hypothetical protein